MNANQVTTKEEQLTEISTNVASSTSLSMDDGGRSPNVVSGSRKCILMKLIASRPPHGNGMDLDTIRMVLAEIVGTFILMFCISAIVAITQLLKGEVGLIEYAATAGMTVVVVIFSVGPISGAHMNPAITIAFTIFSQFSWSRALLYIIAQLTGSVLATYAGHLVYGVDSDLMITRPLRGCASSFWVELVAMFIIVLLVAALTYNHRSVGQLSGFIVGTAIGLAVIITGPISGGSVNPARSLGPAIVHWDFKFIWIYITAPIIGAIAGGFTYQHLRLQGRRGSSTSSPPPNVGFLGYF